MVSAALAPSFVPFNAFRRSIAAVVGRLKTGSRRVELGVGYLPDGVGVGEGSSWRGIRGRGRQICMWALRIL